AGSVTKQQYLFYSEPCHPQGLDTKDMRIEGSGAAAFRLIRDSCPDVILPASAECSITVTFAPPGLGPFNATVYIPEVGSAATGHDIIPLSGTAFLGATLRPTTSSPPGPG